PLTSALVQLLHRVDNLVDQTELLRVVSTVLGARQNELRESILQPQHPHGAGDATRPGQQAESDLGEPELHVPRPQRDAVVAGQRDLKASAESRAVDR